VGQDLDNQILQFPNDINKSIYSFTPGVKHINKASFEPIYNPFKL